MLGDLDLIVRQFPKEFETLRVYAIGDVHVGSQEFDEKAVKKKINIVKDDPNGCLVLCGDLGDYGLKNSKTNVYKATMHPMEQQEYIYELFAPVADKITAAVPGNHEERITREVGTCPLYDLCVRWGIADVYRENLAITKYSFGTMDGRPTKQNVFIGITTHGSTRAKHKKFISCFDNVDFAVSGHTHTPEYSPHGRIRVQPINGTASVVAYKELVVDANLTAGGYGLKKEYEILPPREIQYLELWSYRDNGPNRTNHKMIDYHALQV